ncbi:MAG: hypothetical protein DMF62_02140 [Acidobacteria bacterium]|nr:MAG: hypothetical protein DMF62_02140 [Acidobacteriota bacterium]
MRIQNCPVDIRVQKAVLTVLFAAIFLIPGVHAQTTSISYQGSLSVSNAPANGSFDFEFKLFDSLAGPTQVGSTVTRTTVNVANGTFAVSLDFGGGAFNGSNRFLEVSARPAGVGSYTPLTPRSQILSTPYAIKANLADSSISSSTATNAQQLGSIAADQYVLTGDARLSNARTPTSGSTDYIQNKTGTPQASANLTIDGTATAANINASQFYQLNGQRLIFTATGSLFVGPNIALNNSGTNNAFFGSGAGTANTSGAANSFFGSSSGTATTVGQSNAFFGNAAGSQNLNGSFNVYVGQFAGQANIAGQANTFIGTNAGATPPSGSNNVAVGADAGNAPTLGSNNTFIGKGAIPNAAGLNFATAIGSGAVVGTSNTIVLGRGNDNTLVSGILQIGSGSGGASTAVCVNGSNQLGICASSIRYKSDIENFTGGLNIIRRLRPIQFSWTDGGMHDVGFAAEEVNNVEPLLTVFGKTGEIVGVKYGQISAVLVNALNEQQGQIDAQRLLIQKQQAQIDVLMRLVCAGNKKAKVCRAN